MTSDPDCGYVRQREEALKPFRDLRDKAEGAVGRLMTRIDDWMERH